MQSSTVAIVRELNKKIEVSGHEGNESVMSEFNSKYVEISAINQANRVQAYEEVKCGESKFKQADVMRIT